MPAEAPPGEEKLGTMLGEKQAGNGEDKANLKFKNTVVVGIRISDQDFIRGIDLNEISQENPYIYTLSANQSPLLQRQASTGHNSSTGNILQRSFDRMTAAEFIRSQEEDEMELQR